MELKLVSPKYGEKIVLIDDEDFPKVKNMHWSISFVRGNWYAIHGFMENGKRKQIKMHRLIMQESNISIKIDHKNHNGLDNRKINLRKATIRENTRNTGLTIRNKTGYKGVFNYTCDNGDKVFVVRIRTDNGKVFGGYFKKAEEAAKKYNEMALRFHGEFAFLNKIPNE